MSKLFLIGFFTFFFQFGALASNYVPFAFWTNIRSECIADVPLYPGQDIVKFIKSDYFKCLQKQHPDKIKLFLLEELDAADFSFQGVGKNNKAFENLQQILGSTSSVVMPDVQSTDLVSYITGTMKESFENAEFSIKELPRIKRENVEELEESLSRIDNMIHEEIKETEESGEYIAILTAESSPQERTYRDVESAPIGRQLLATQEDFVNRTTFINAECIFLTFQNVTLTYNKQNLNLTSPELVDKNCNLTDNTRLAVLKFTVLNFTAGVDQEVQMSLKFEKKIFPVSKRNWWFINSTILTHSLNGTSLDFDFNGTEVYTAPFGWSWVCESPPTMTYRTNRTAEVSQKLAFQYLQVQPFDLQNNSFSRPLDCTGILSGPIWMGTVVSLLLAAIFAFGLSMMASLSTMDRFDDPRGKAILVHTHDNN